MDPIPDIGGAIGKKSSDFQLGNRLESGCSALAPPEYGSTGTLTLPDFGNAKSVIFTHGIDRANPTPRCCPDGLRKNR
jgi:hypothetical protein